MVGKPPWLIGYPGWFRMIANSSENWITDLFSDLESKQKLKLVSYLYSDLLSF